MTEKKILSVNLGLLYEPWKRYCDAHGVSRSDATRQVIRKLVTRGSEVAAEDRSTSILTGDPKVRVEIRLLADEHRVVSEQAATAGFSINSWVIALIRARLTGSAQFGQAELENLAISNSRLLAIGRNLNQITRLLNAAPTELAQLRPESIETLASEIKSHTVAVGALIQSNVQRWSR